MTELTTAKPYNELKRPTLVALMAIFAMGYFAAIWLLGQVKAIEIGNMIMLSLASGIVVAYTPTAWNFTRYENLDGATILSFGIWLGWASITYRTGGVVLWRLLEKPDAWLDSALWGLHILGSCCSAICHLLGPEAMNGRVPTKQWIRIGIMVAIAVFAAAILTLFSLPDL